MTLLEGRPPRVRRVLRGFEQPRYTAFAADGGHAFVTDSGSGELAVIDLRAAASPGACASVRSPAM